MRQPTVRTVADDVVGVDKRLGNQLPKIGKGGLHAAEGTGVNASTPERLPLRLIPPIVVVIERLVSAPGRIRELVL